MAVKQKDQPELPMDGPPSPTDNALVEADRATLLAIEQLARVVLYRAEGWRDLHAVDLDRLDEAYRRLMSVRQIFRDLVE